MAKRQAKRVSIEPESSPRLLFQRVGEKLGRTLGAAETLRQMAEQQRATSKNVGNLVHLEAPMKLLRYRPQDAPRSRDLLNPDSAYDGVVLGYANMIRAPKSGENEAEVHARDAAWLATTTCRIYALGIGIQDKLPPRRDAVHPHLFDVLTVLNDRAAIFGVRGKETEAWLHAVGLRNARALGCPSMFVYPRNVMSIRSPDKEASLRIATAGRLQRHLDMNRVGAIVRIGERFHTSYVFQNDFHFATRAQDPDAVIYNDASGEVLRQPVMDRGRDLGFDLPFRDYWLFRSTEKWRGFAAGKDAYFGDRFHGGVVFLQVGKPAIIVQNDARVGELTAFYDLPTATTEELLQRDPREIFHERLSPAALRRMRATYATRYRNFYEVLRGAGLELFNDVSPDVVDGLIS